MKKFICFFIFIISFLQTNYSIAEITSFNRWLFENGHTDLVKKEVKEICKNYEKDSKEWISNYCNIAEYKNNYDIYTYPQRYWIPSSNPKPKPNYMTLAHEFYKKMIYTKPQNNVSVSGSPKPYIFEFNISENKFDKHIDRALSRSGLLSYMYYENGEIKIDKISPKERFGKFIKEDTMFKSHSVGKSLAAYITGHAICEGYIDSINTRINDWPIVNNTLYYDQELINLLNFKAGDQKFVYDYYVKNPKWTRYNETSVEALLNHEFQGSKKSRAIFNYSSFLANLVINYVAFKTDDDFEKFLNKIFKDKAKLKNGIIFRKYGNKPQGNMDARFYATRYDYMRIAKLMLDDWRNDTCVGKYLKTIFESRYAKNVPAKYDPFDYAKSYAGMMHTGFKNFSSKRPVMGMHGYGGQQVVIDFENSRIIIAHSVHGNWDDKKIIYSLIKKGIN